VSESEEINRREVAYRLFAAEFDDADYSYAESDEERAPNYVVTPTGARVNRVFVVGVLTEIEQVNEDVVRARVVDPTGAFVVYAGQYQPEALAALESAETPSFVAVTGKARTFSPDDSDVVYTSIRPETVSEVDADTRDRWVVTTAEQTVDRVATMAAAYQRVERDDQLRQVLESAGVDYGLAAGIPLALDHYGTSPAYLAAVRELALDAARVVSGDVESAGELELSPTRAARSRSTSPRTSATSTSSSPKLNPSRKLPKRSPRPPRRKRSRPGRRSPQRPNPRLPRPPKTRPKPPRSRRPNRRPRTGSRRTPNRRPPLRNRTRQRPRRRRRRTQRPTPPKRRLRTRTKPVATPNLPRRTRRPATARCTNSPRTSARR